MFTTSVLELRSPLHFVFEIRSVEMDHCIGTVLTAWQSVSLSDQRRHSGTSHPVVVSGICAGTYTYKKLNKVTSVLRLIPRPVHNQMPNVSNISALPPLCLTNTWERSHSLSAVFGSNNSVFLLTLYRLYASVQPQLHLLSSLSSPVTFFSWCPGISRIRLGECNRRITSSVEAKRISGNSHLPLYRKSPPTKLERSGFRGKSG